MATTSSISGSSLPTLSSPGVGSGLDINTLVSKLMAVEQQPLTALATKETAYQTKLSAYGTLKSVLSSLQGAMTNLATPSTFQTMSATLGDASIATVAAAKNAQPGSYNVEVTSLAQAQKLKSTTFNDAASEVGSGSISVQFGSFASGTFAPNTAKAAKTIAIPAGTGTLSGVRDAINAAGAGVTASIVNDGTGNRLVITSADSGTSNALKISVSDDDGNNGDGAGLSRLAYDAGTGGTANMAETVAAADAKVKIDGMTITKPSNTITDAVSGLTLTLTKLGGPTTLSVTRNTGSVTSAVNGFVQAWNSANSAIAQMSAYDPTTKTAAVLQGDTTLQSVQDRLRNLLNKPLSPAVGGLSYLADVGIGFQLDGSLSLNSSKLQSVLADPNKDVSALFADAGQADDPLVSFSSATPAAQPGSYGLQVSQLATRGKAAGDTAAALNITTGGNDTLELSVNGKGVSVTLPPGTYTADTLAAQLQSQINGNPAMAANGSSVVVSQSGGVLSVTSNLYGANSSVQITGGGGFADLFGAPASAPGQDVSGSIGGATATGKGQLLSSPSLSVLVSGGATGSRGQIGFAHGFASQIGSLMSSLVGATGMLQSRVDGINSSIADIESQRTAMNQRLTAVEANYRAQFNALDSMLASMQSTSTYLTQQLASLPGVVSTSTK